MIFPCAYYAKDVPCERCTEEAPWLHFCSDDCASLFYEMEDPEMAHDWCIGWKE
jgi:hypothetical protein